MNALERESLLQTNKYQPTLERKALLRAATLLVYGTQNDCECTSCLERHEIADCLRKMAGHATSKEWRQ